MRTGGRLLNNSTLALSRCPPRRTLSTLIKNAARRTQLAPRVASLRLSPRPAGVSVDKHCEKAKDTGRPRIRYQSLARLPTPCPSPPADTSPFPYEKGDEYSCPRAAVVPSDVGVVINWQAWARRDTEGSASSPIFPPSNLHTFDATGVERWLKKVMCKFNLLFFLLDIPWKRRNYSSPFHFSYSTDILRYLARKLRAWTIWRRATGGAVRQLIRVTLEAEGGEGGRCVRSHIRDPARREPRVD